MKILWIEDFGGGLIPSKIVIEMFSRLIPEYYFDLEYLPDEDVSSQLSELFRKHTLHQVFVCKSYRDWKEVFRQQSGDFDVALIDINLERYKTPSNEMPDGMDISTFDKKAGFHIFHQLIREGFPDDNIAFFTGEENSLKEFTKYCGEILIDRPKNTFEKKPADFERLRDWLSAKASNEHLILRRGVIEGCRLLKNELGKIAITELENRLLFYKTTSIDISHDPEVYRTELIDYFTKLETFFLLNQHENKRYRYFSFVRELVEKWDISYGYFNRDKESPIFKTKLEDRFYKTLQFQMKRLRNLSVHGQLSNNITERDVAYFFMLAMRSWIQFQITDCFDYEKILSQLFDSITNERMAVEMDSNIERHLEQSYFELRWHYTDIARNLSENPTSFAGDNQFLALFKALGEVPERVEGHHANILKRKIREKSMSLFYQSYWHGLFPMWVKSTYYANLPSVGFNIESIPSDSFLYFLGSLVFKESFKEQKSSVVVT
jgi:hypothetical protein